MIDRTQHSFDDVGGTAPGEIGNLTAKFLIEDGGAFGRDKSVALDEASSARRRRRAVVGEGLLHA